MYKIYRVNALISYGTKRGIPNHDTLLPLFPPPPPANFRRFGDAGELSKILLVVNHIEVIRTGDERLEHDLFYFVFRREINRAEVLSSGRDGVPQGGPPLLVLPNGGEVAR